MKTVITVLLIVLFLGGCSIKLPEHKPAYTPGDDYAKAYVAYAAGQKEISITALKQAGASVRAIAYVVGAVEISKQFGGNDSSQETTTTTTTETSETFAPVE